MEGPEWAAGKLSEDHKDNRWSLLSADLRELEQANAARKDEQRENVQVTLEIKQRIAALEQQILAWAGEDVDGDFAARIAYLEQVCEQCILEHQGRSI